MTKITLEPWYGGFSYSKYRPHGETLQELITRLENDGWEFVTILPGDERAVRCEYHSPPKVVFRKREGHVG